MRVIASALLILGFLMFGVLAELDARHPKGLDDHPDIVPLALSGLLLGSLFIATGAALLWRKPKSPPSSSSE
jgi:hypothetical protein